MDSPNQIDDWATQSDKASMVSRLRILYKIQAESLFHQFESTRSQIIRFERDFFDRLEKWLAGFPDDSSRWSAFRSIEYIFFAGQSEFDELYRSSLEHIIKPWLIDTCGLNVFDETIERKLDAELAKCWPCPVTDSLRINGFLHVSGMRGQKLRPDWYSLRTLGDETRIAQFCATNAISHLILLEDFVGMGKQFSDALEWAARQSQLRILAAPLIVCAPGHRRLSKLATTLGTHVTYKPGLIIEDHCLLTPERNAAEPKLFDDLRSAVEACRGVFKFKPNQPEAYGHKGTGSLVMLYSNCPNNVPPIFHLQAEGWNPIFPRSGRR